MAHKIDLRDSHLPRWRYTVGVKWRLIVAAGYIRPATAGVPTNEKPIVWFSTNQFYEPTASKDTIEPDGRLSDLGMMGTHRVFGGLVRIGVLPETAPYDWRALKELSGMHPLVAKGLYETALRDGSRPGEWWGTFDPVGADDWIAVEAFDGERWVAMESDSIRTPGGD